MNLKPFELGLTSQKDKKVRLQRDLRKKVAGPTEDVLKEGQEEATEDNIGWAHICV